MENENVIREQMEDTRTSLTEKLETLEQQVASTVQGATSNIADTVEAVKETVEKVKDSVEDTVTTVKESVEETIETVKETVHEGLTAVKGMFDIPALVDAHPWLMFGGAVGGGFVLGALSTHPARPRSGYLKSQARSALPDHYTGEDRSAFVAPTRSKLSWVFQTFEPEIHRLKGLALGALMSSVRGLVLSKVPENIAPKLSEVLDSVTHKLGGEMLPTEHAHADNGHTGNGAGRGQASEWSAI